MTNCTTLSLNKYVGEYITKMTVYFDTESIKALTFATSLN